MRALILGGTPSARAIAQDMFRSGWRVTTSVPEYGALNQVPIGEVHVGGFGGPAGLTQWLLSQGVELIIDASDPFAERISLSASEAARALRIPLVILDEPRWTPERADKWHFVDSMSEAASASSRFHHILLDVGDLNIAPFAADADNLYVIRGSVGAQPHLPARFRRIPAKDTADVAEEKKIIRDNQIDCVVIRETLGHPPAVVEAARGLGVTVVILRAPDLNKGSFTARSVEDVISYASRM